MQNVCCYDTSWHLAPLLLDYAFKQGGHRLSKWVFHAICWKNIPFSMLSMLAKQIPCFPCFPCCGGHPVTGHERQHYRSCILPIVRCTMQAHPHTLKIRNEITKGHWKNKFIMNYKRTNRVTKWERSKWDRLKKLTYESWERVSRLFRLKRRCCWVESLVWLKLAGGRRGGSIRIIFVFRR